MKNSYLTSLFACLFLYSLQTFGTVVVLNGLTHQHAGVDGSVIVGKIKLKNDGEKSERFVAYKQDLIASCGGSDVFSGTVSHDRTLKNWLKTSVDEKTLAGGEEYDLSYTINIPQEIPRKGTYWLVIMIEPGDPIATTEKSGLNITSKVRYAIQIIVDMGTFESPQMTFEDISFKKTEMAPRVVAVQVKNNGLFAVRTKMQLEIYDSKGNKIKVLEAKSRRVFPEKCSNFEIEVSDLPKGKYDGVLVADNGKNLIGSNLAIEIE